MAEEQDLDPLELFKNETHDDTQIHCRALKMLSTVAVALDVDRTRHELIPYLEEYMASIYFKSDESLSIIAEQLGKFSPFIGGTEFAHILFPMLTKLAAADDMETRENAISSLQHIASLMNGMQLEEYFIEVVKTLAEAEWFTSKCSAAPLFPVVYPKVSDDAKNNLRNMFSTLLQDESPMVRRAAASSFSDFVKNADMECIKNEFIPSFKDVAKDDQDSVRLLAVNAAIALAHRLTTEEIETHVMATLQALCSDSSWRVKYRFAHEINEIQSAIGPELTRKSLIEMYKQVVRDQEANIREISARRIVRFCELLQKSYSGSSEDKDRLDPVIRNEMLPLIKELDDDIVEDVQDGLYSVITSLSALLGEHDTKDFLLPLITNSITNESRRVKENIITNLNNIIGVIGIEDLSKTVEKLMSDLLNNSNTLWRTRRNLIVTLSHIAKHSTQDYFDEHLKPLYLTLLSDQVNGVRRVAPLAFPLFAKHFNMEWTKTNIVQILLEFMPKKYYLSRMTCLFCMDELIVPAVSKPGEAYLQKLKCIQDQNSAIVLNKIQKLNTILSDNLKMDWVDIVLKYYENASYFNDDIKTYAEESLDALTQCSDQHIVTISQEEIQNCQEESYLEGLLFLILVYFLDITRDLAEDKVYNVRMRAAKTLHNIAQLNESLRNELEEPWVNNVLDMISTDEKETLADELQTNLLSAHNAFVELKKQVIVIQEVQEKTQAQDDAQKEHAHNELVLKQNELALEQNESVSEQKELVLEPSGGTDPVQKETTAVIVPNEVNEVPEVDCSREATDQKVPDDVTHEHDDITDKIDPTVNPFENVDGHADYSDILGTWDNQEESVFSMDI